MSSFTPGMSPGTSLSRVIRNGIAGNSEHLREREGGREEERESMSLLEMVKLTRLCSEQYRGRLVAMETDK